MNNWDETLDSVPATVVAHVRARNGGASAISFLENVWEWCGMTMPVIQDFLHGHVLATSMVYLLWKYGRGGLVELRISSWGKSRMLRRWMREFGETHTVIWFDEEEASGGLRSVKTVSLGMFVWAVRCGILGEGDL